MAKPGRWTFDSRTTLLAAALFGALMWIAVSRVTSSGEAWDHPAYFRVGYPLLALASGALGFLHPERSWRWPASMMGAQVTVAVLSHPTAGLLPLGLIVFALLALPLVGVARLGAWFAQRTTA